MDRIPALALLATALLAGCAPMHQSSGEPFWMLSQQANPTLSAMINCLANQENLSLKQRQQQLDSQLKSPAQQTSLKQFQKACLLGHTQATNEELRQAQQILNRLTTDEKFATDERQALIAIYQRKLELMLALRQQVRETREYRDKIEQLKGLEEQLETEAPLPSSLPKVSS